MPKFQRISLIGSEELFRPTKREIEHEDEVFDAETGVNAEAPAAEAAPSEAAPADDFSGRAQAAPNPAPLGREKIYYRLQLSREQIATLVDGIQSLKYPGQVRSDAKPSMEDFEYLESLRKTLLDSF